MMLMKKMNLRLYVGMNLVLAALFANVVLFGGRLRMGESFTAGLATGIAVGWIIFAVSGWLELKRPGRAFDERAQLILNRAASLAFWAMILVSCIASVLSRSELLAWEIEARDMAALMTNFGLASFLLAWAFIGRRS